MEFNPFSLAGKTILVTGASSGIGRQCAIDCSKMGARVVLVGRNEERLAKTRNQMDGNGGGHSSLILDLSNTNEIGSAIQNMVSEIGPLDGFIHAAGIEITLPVKCLKPSDYETVYRLNSISAFEIIRHLSVKHRYNPGASYILISSISSLIGRGGIAAYAASKGALVAAARSVAIELAPKNIRINCVSPGTILTPMMEKQLADMTPEQQERRLSGFLLGIGHVEDISNACIYLLSNASKWVTGQNLVVDGGYTVR